MTRIYDLLNFFWYFVLLSTLTACVGHLYVHWQEYMNDLEMILR